MNEIFSPSLPPKNGYIEAIDENGEHIYVPTPETEEKLKNERLVNELYSVLSILLGG